MAPPVGEVRFITSGTFVVSCIAATVGFVFSTVFLTFNVYHRKKRFMKMSSPNLNVLISSGGLIMNSTCMLYGIEYFFRHLYSHATVICQMRMWLISLGVTLLFCPMFVKSWRVYQIFKNAGIKRVVITDIRLIMVIAAFLGVDIFILALWQGIDPPQSRPMKVVVQTQDFYNSTHVYIQECVSYRMDVWLSVILFWKAFLLGSGLFLAWKTKHVLLPAMRDSSCMIISILSTMFLTSQSMMMSSSLRHLPDAVYIIYVMLLTICASMVQTAVFFPKVRFYWKSSLEQQMRMSVSAYDLQPHVPAVDHFEEEVVQLVAENDTLKKSLTQKNSMIQILEGHLNNAKKTLQRMTSDENVKMPKRREGKIDSGLDVSSSSFHEEDENDVTFDDQHLACQKLKEIHEQSNTPSNCLQETYAITPETVIKRVVVCRTNSDRTGSRDIRRKRLKGLSSESFITSTTEEMLHLKEEIDADLTQAHMLSTSLRTSIENDLQRSVNDNASNWVFDSMKSRQDIAGSVARCYDLEDNSDTYTYVSSYFPCKIPKRKLDYNFKPNPDHVSSECIQSFLPNDKLYPTNNSSGTQSGKSYMESKESESLSKGYNSVNSPRKIQFTKYLVSEVTGVKSYYL